MEFLCTGDVDWQAHDPAERPTRGVNVRFNDYEMTLLRTLAQREDRSMMKIIKRYLIPAIKEAV